MNAIAKTSLTHNFRQQLQASRDRLARSPMDSFPFHRGASYAHSLLGYNPDKLALLPVECIARFAGVGNPLSIGNVYRGETVLDHACGSGMDLLLAARQVGESGKAIGVEMTAAMRDCASVSADLMDAANVHIRSGVIESLPVEDQSVDLVLSNGAVNLATDKAKAIQELYRVLKPGGRVYLSAVVVQYPLPQDYTSDEDFWTAGISGAQTEATLMKQLAKGGFIYSAVVRRFNCFHNSVLEKNLPQDIFAHSINIFATKY